MHYHDSTPPAPRRIALAVGDTAGHAYPALAVAEAFRQRDPGARILFLGTADSIAARILARHGEALMAVPGAPIRRAGFGGLPRAAGQTLASVRAARRVLAAPRIAAAIGFGGFASAGVLIAARSLGAWTAIHEANVEPGLANAWLRHLVHRVYLAHPGALPQGVLVGLPVRSAIAALRARDRTPPSGRLNLLVTSGSRGAAFFLDRVPAVVAELAARQVDVTVRQQPLDGFLDTMPDAYQWADAAITRGGAGSLAELAAAGVPSIVVPLADAADNHQQANAERWGAAGAGLVIRESSWTPQVVAEWLFGLANRKQSWLQASNAARALAPHEAAACRMVDDVLAHL